MDRGKQTFDLASIRLEKGLTQQELADQSGLTSRTIQRIEKGEVIPYGDSVRKLAQALGLSIAELYSTSANIAPADTFETTTTIENNNRSETKATAETNILSFFHFLPLVGIIFPFCNLLLPLFLWINYRNRNGLYDYHGRISINFQLTMSLLLMLLIVLLVFYFPVGFALLTIAYLYAIVSCIVNGIRTLGNKLPRYPLAIPFLKLPSHRF